MSTVIFVGCKSRVRNTTKDVIRFINNSPSYSALWCLVLRCRLSKHTTTLLSGDESSNDNYFSAGTKYKMGKKFHFNNVFLCAIFLQNYLSKMKMFHLGSIYLFMKKKIQESITTASQLRKLKTRNKSTWSMAEYIWISFLNP